MAILRDDAGALIDTLSLKDDGLHGDGVVGDGLWGGLVSPSRDGKIHVSVRTDDLTAGTSRTLAEAATIVFARGALISINASTVDLGRMPITLQKRDTTFAVRNIGFAPDSLTVSVDPGNVVPDTAIAVSPISFILAPADSQRVTFSVRANLLAPGYYTAGVTMIPKAGIGQSSLSKVFLFEIVIAGEVSEADGLPGQFVLRQNHPNPFNPSTTIRYGLPNRSNVTLSVFNTLGQQVATLVQEEQDAGDHDVKFDGRKLPSGVYLYRMVAGSFVETKKLLLVR